MTIPGNLIANADDFGYNSSVNKAIVYCFEQGYINSTSLMVNTALFDETVQLIRQNSTIHNIGVHINLAEGKPVTNFTQDEYLDKNGDWDFNKVNQRVNFFTAEVKSAFSKEIHAQIDRAISNKLPINHIDSHCHLHTLPCFYKLFSEAAKSYNLKIRLAQTFNEGNYLKFYLRKYINSIFKEGNKNYSDYFETVEQFLKDTRATYNNKGVIEIMLHPYYDQQGMLTDHYDKETMQDWIRYLENVK